MSDTIPCPGCRAELVLPGLPEGETVQCPRCQHVFAASRGRATPVSAASRRVTIDDAPDDPLDFSHPFALYQPLRGQRKASVAIFFLVASVLSYGAQFYVNRERIELILLEEKLNAPRRVRDFHFQPDGEFVKPFERRRFKKPQMDPGMIIREAQLEELGRRWEKLLPLSDEAFLLHHVTFWPTILFVMIWLNQAAWNLRILKASSLAYSPSGATFSFFVPFANFWWPYKAVQEIWRASDPIAARDPNSWLSGPCGQVVRVWWFAFVAAAILSLAALLSSDPGMNRQFDQISLELRQARLACASNLCMIVAGAALIWVIHGIRGRQRGRHARIYDEAV